MLSDKFIKSNIKYQYNLDESMDCYGDFFTGSKYASLIEKKELNGNEILLSVNVGNYSTIVIIFCL